MPPFWFLPDITVFNKHKFKARMMWTDVYLEKNYSSGICLKVFQSFSPENPYFFGRVESAIVIEQVSTVEWKEKLILLDQYFEVISVQQDKIFLYDREMEIYSKNFAQQLEQVMTLIE